MKYIMCDEDVEFEKVSFDHSLRENYGLELLMRSLANIGYALRRSNGYNTNECAEIIRECYKKIECLIRRDFDKEWKNHLEKFKL